MPFYSANQEIDIRFKEEVISADVNKKLKDVLGANAKISGLTLSHVSGLNCKINAGRIVIQGASIEESADITIPIPSNSGNPIKTHYLYATYTHAEGAVCSYELLEAPTVAANYLLIGQVYMPAGATTVTPGNVTNIAPARGVVALDAALAALASTVATNTSNISIIDGDLTTAEGKIATLEGKMTTAEGEIDTLQTQMGTANTNIGTLTTNLGTTSGKVTTLEGKMTTAEGEIDTLQGQMGTANTNIGTLQTQMGTANSNISNQATAITNRIEWSNKTTKQTEQINKLNIGGALMELNGAAPTGTTNITLNAHFTATKVFGAVFNDYAEWFERGEPTQPGDIIALMDGDKEQYGKATRFISRVLVGVHSDEFAQCIGADGAATSEEDYIPVGMMGRVHVKVKGPVRAGDYIVLSEIPGVGRPSTEPSSFGTVGQAVESYYGDEIKRVRCLLGRH